MHSDFLEANCRNNVRPSLSLKPYFNSLQKMISFHLSGQARVKVPETNEHSSLLLYEIQYNLILYCRLMIILTR